MISLVSSIAAAERFNIYDADFAAGRPARTTARLIGAASQHQVRMDTPGTQSTASDRDWFRIGAAMRLRLGSLAILDEPLRIDIGIAKEESRLSG